LRRDTDERARQEVERQLRITRFVNSYEGGDCFFVKPTVVAADRATLDGYGSTVAPFEVLDDEFKRVNGFEALIGVHQVTPPQCAAVTFLSRVRNQPGVVPRLEINPASLKIGSDITGTVADFGGRNVHLLLVSDNGAVRDFTGSLKPDGDAKSFALILADGELRPAQPQLLVAIVSNAPLEAFRLPRTGPAAEVFARALDEARDTGQILNVSAWYFKLEK